MSTYLQCIIVAWHAGLSRKSMLFMRKKYRVMGSQAFQVLLLR